MKNLNIIALVLLSSLLSAVMIPQACAQVPTISYTGSPYTFIVGIATPTLTPSVTGSPVINGQTSTLAGTGSAGYVNGTGSGASFNQPIGIVSDASGNLYVSDVGNEVIRKITPAGVVTTFAGTGTPGSTNGTGTAAAFYHPVQICVDGSGNIYVADEDNNMIRKMTSAGVVTTLAGQVTAGFTNSTGASAKFNLPCGVAVDAAGNVYVADYNNNAIRKITTTGVVSTFAGSTTGVAGSANGTGTAATFHNPFSLAIDASGNLYVADRSNNMIRKITSAGVVTTLAGHTAGGFANGTGTTASFSMPTTVTTDAPGNVYVADEGNNMIRKITPAGVVTTLSGASFDDEGWVDGVGTAAMFYNPFAVATDPYGNIFVCDLTKNFIRKVVSTPYTISPALPAGLAFNTSTGVISGATTVAATAANYTAVAYNATGMGTTALNITSLLIPMPQGSPNQNYVMTSTPRISGLTTGSAVTAASIYNTQVETAIQYFDGLGRPLQTIQAEASPTGKDMVQPFGYDGEGRDSVAYLPYTISTTTPGAYQPGALKGTGGYTGSAQYQFYQQTGQGYVNTTNPYTPTAFEPSGLNRPVEQGAPGVPWQLSTSGISGSGHTVKMLYKLNNDTSFSTDSVHARQAAWYNATINADQSRTLVANGYYPAGKLTVTITKDENWVSGRAGTVEEYKDMEGHVVLKRQYNYVGTAVQVLSTYYVYDDFGQLAFVLPPASGADAAATISQTTLNNLCYQYRYDDHGRLSQKKIPGKWWEYVVYNYIDQPVATQDSLQRVAHNWMVTKYDGMGRVVQTAVRNSGTVNITRAALQDTLTKITANLCEKSLTTGNGYTNVAWPTNNITATLTWDYYDSYANAPGLTSTSYSAPTGTSVQTRGLPVAKKTAVLNTPANTLWDVMYYDDLGRPTKTYAQHYLGATVDTGNYDLITTTYNFLNQLTTVKRAHWNTVNRVHPLLTIFNKFIYDQAGRKLKTWEQITNGASSIDTNRLISKIDYNEIGQVLNKHLHSKDSVTFLQNIAYTYNERGWLLTSSAPLFAMQLYYNTSTNKAYNGNIMYQYWGTPVGGLTKYYVYTYDKLNRLLAGFSSLGNNESVAYDVMGNITALSRSTTSTLTDGLTYSYTSGGSPTNQLQSIIDGSGSNTGLVAGTTAYTYDANGNMLSGSNTVNTAQNKSFTYNLLNLPLVATVAGGTVTYTYDATGNKLRKVSTVLGNTTDYISGIQYDGATTPALSFIQTEEGKAVPNGTSYDYTYYLGDNLGNTRVTFDTKTGAAVSQQTDDYYPFGMEVLSNVSSPKNEYLYNKKEKQEELQEYDYGARFYDPVIGRMTTIDRFSEKYMGNSPYEYGADNPILNIDMNGDSVGVSKTVTQNKDLNKAFNAFASTKAGRKFLGKYAAKGQTIGGYTFTKSGKYNDKGIDLNYGAKNLGDNTVGGQTDESVAKNGRAEIDVTLNTQTRSGVNSEADDVFDKSSSIIHESFLHVNMDTQDFLDNGKFDNSNIDPSIRNNPLINQGDWQHIQVLQDFSKRGYYPGSSWPLEGIRALQEVNQNNNNGRTPGQILQKIWQYHGGLNIDTNGKVQ